MQLLSSWTICSLHGGSRVRWSIYEDIKCGDPPSRLELEPGWFVKRPNCKIKLPGGFKSVPTQHEHKPTLTISAERSPQTLLLDRNLQNRLQYSGNVEEWTCTECVCMGVYDRMACTCIRACALHCICQLPHDRGMQKHASLEVETICLTCNQLSPCQGVYIEAACLEEKKKNGQDFINQCPVQVPRVYAATDSVMLITGEMSNLQSGGGGP